MIQEISDETIIPLYFIFTSPGKGKNVLGAFIFAFVVFLPKNYLNCTNWFSVLVLIRGTFL
jgi:hypothetical protein